MPTAKGSEVHAVPTQPPAMTRLDRSLQRQRIARALPWIEPGAHVLDVGCADGALFRLAGERISSGVGIEPTPVGEWPAEWTGRFERRVGGFPDATAEGETYDAIVMLAVVEHIPEPELQQWAGMCARLLRPGGRLILTVPSPAVDTLLHWGIRLRLLAGMDAHHHHGFSPHDVPPIFGSQLTLVRRRSFQIGLNNLFVFRR